MSTVSIVLRAKPNNKNLFPLAIRITKDRKSNYIQFGQYIKQEDWDVEKQRVKASHPNSKRLNNLILKKLSDSNEFLIDDLTEVKDVSAVQLKQKIKKPQTKKAFKGIAEDYLLDLEKTKKYNRLSGDKPRVKHFLDFLNGIDISFADITPGLLQKYIVYLKAMRGVGERTVMNHLVLLRTVFNRAIEHGAAETKYYPFGKGKIRIKFPESSKVGLVEAEILKIDALDLKPGSPQSHARNIWLFSFYLAGIRVSDVLRMKWTDFKDGRLNYIMGKT